MKRLPVKQAALVTPQGNKDDIKRAVEKLGVGERFDNSAIAQIYFQLSKIIGRWFEEQSARESSSVAKALLSTAKSLTQAAEILGGHEAGFHSHGEIESTAYVKRILASNPNIGSIDEAGQLLRTFNANAAEISRACMEAYSDLKSEAAKGSRETLYYYDDFVDLLLDIAAKGGVEPKQFKDRVTGERRGWLFDAAQTFEAFLYKPMRSPGPEACGKRLERAVKRLRRYTTNAPRT